MSISKEKQISIVISHKRKIVRLTNKILEILHESSVHEKISDEQKLLIRKLINEVVSELTTVASFCGSKERDWANRMTEIAARTSGILDYVWIPLFEFWCTMVNGITLDFNKTPFKFFGGDFKVKWHEFETRLRAVADRRQPS